MFIDRSATSRANCRSTTTATQDQLDAARAKLLQARNRRVWPGRDEKILTSWNGLAIGGLAAASRTLERCDYAEAAHRAVRFLREHCWRDGRLLAVHKDGRSRFPAYLDDYASLAWGLLELRAGALGYAQAFDWAVELARSDARAFRGHATAGGFYFTADDGEALMLRPKTFADDATPAGNGVAARASGAARLSARRRCAIWTRPNERCAPHTPRSNGIRTDTAAC